jgi:2-oxoisovalerate dehydrogenase E1 component subunit alpha
MTRTVPETPGDGRDTTLLTRVYKVAMLGRAVDLRLWILSRQGRVSFVLTPRGHEIAQVASTAAMRRGHDSAWPYYRDLCVGLALGVTPYELFLGAMGRAADPHTGGRQLTAHLSSPELLIGSVSSAIAAHIPHAVGAAYASRVNESDSVAFCWFGDGAASEGVTHEAMNFAAIHRLAVIFLCENNRLAISVPIELQMPIQSVAERASAYRIPGISVDGTDPTAVFEVASAAATRARSGEGPSLIEMLVPRITAHSSQDDDAYRTEAEIAAAAFADPLPKLRQQLIAAGLLTNQQDESLQSSVNDLVLAASERAFAMPAPDSSRARRWLYAGDPPAEVAAAESAGVFDD